MPGIVDLAGHLMTGRLTTSDRPTIGETARFELRLFAAKGLAPGRRTSVSGPFD